MSFHIMKNIPKQANIDIPHLADNYKSNSIKGNRKILSITCPSHGRFNMDHCPKCREEAINKNKSAAYNSNNWVRGWWEHLDTNPIYIESKEHLIRECIKRGKIPKAFSGPKSRGKGIELKYR